MTRWMSVDEAKEIYPDRSKKNKQFCISFCESFRQVHKAFFSVLPVNRHRVFVLAGQLYPQSQERARTQTARDPRARDQRPHLPQSQRWKNKTYCLCPVLRADSNRRIKIIGCMQTFLFYRYFLEFKIIMVPSFK